MIYVINYALVLIGLSFCAFLVLSHRVDTKARETVGQLSLWVITWLFLLFAAYPNGFNPVPATTVARTIILILNVWMFKDQMINRSPKKSRRKK